MKWAFNEESFYLSANAIQVVGSYFSSVFFFSKESLQFLEDFLKFVDCQCMHYFRKYLLQCILYSFFWASFCFLQRIAINDKHDLFFWISVLTLWCSRLISFTWIHSRKLLQLHFLEISLQIPHSHRLDLLEWVRSSYYDVHSKWVRDSKWV